MAFLYLGSPAPVRADGPLCERLEFVPIAPQGPGPRVSCDPYFDRHACQIKNGLAHFANVSAPSGKKALALKLARPSLADLKAYVAPLEDSPAIQELNRDRILARQLAGHADVCEPNYIYLGSEPIFGVGPAFASSLRFTIQGRETTNVILAEDAKAPYHLPIAMLTKKSLLENGYYDIVVAHELAHGLMQDLYGLDAFERLESLVVSRDGHFASGTTDPRLAWIEGFAEAFEAYLGEKHGGPRVDQTPTLDGLIDVAKSRMDTFEAHGWGGYVFTVPDTVLRTGKLLFNLDDFVSDFLKAERQRAVRENHYVLKGAFNNLVHKYDIMMGSTAEDDIEAIADWEIEATDAVYSKEGVVAYFVYEILKNGLARELFETIAWAHPNDVWEFAEEFRQSITSEQYAVIEPVYKAIFTRAGRAATRALVKNGDTRENRARFERLIAKIPALGDLAPPKDMFIEFWNGAFMHRKLNGRLDRINLATASASRVDAALRQTTLTNEQRREAVSSFLRIRDRWETSSTIDALVMHWQAADQRIEVARASQAFLTMRRCFESNCMARAKHAR